ncbi:DNA-protecting protein DprA [Aliikangiella marina]|uniref:DNA-protecting protein DprA n=1 Tax=Aliikangiella marina TaxID=1712262 RepID=A0A545T1E5_9GAMM|nr:DNA-processing protein DprA [Aliikangiella marina]TQV71033.1 DNA-protecting protein DprA [Aliikangiella marina]
MQHQEIEYLLALRKIKGVGKVTAHKLICHFGNATNLFNASAESLAEAGLKPPIIEQLVNQSSAFRLDADIESALEWVSTANRHIITFDSPFYPPLLAQTYDPPLILFIIGNPELLITPQLAVVGSRKPTVSGINHTQSFCSELADLGLTITSGLASGIDGEAHRAALNAGGKTIAVCGTGLNRVYPAHHRELAHQIAEEGLLVSEMLPNEKQSVASFPNRNRIIAGLSLGTLVVEAAEKSGTLVTARQAMEAGREVFAIPSSIHNPLSKGCHRLIKQGAKLTESINDIVEELPNFERTLINQSTPDKQPPLDFESAEFLKCIDYEVTSLDTIVTRSRLTVEAVTNKLLALELQGWVINSVGGYIRQ